MNTLLPPPDLAAQALSVIGSRAEVIFGRSEHIALVRVRSRRTRSWETPRRHLPVSIRDIPSLADGASAPNDQQPAQPVTTLSLWDWLTAPGAMGTMQASLPTVVASEPTHSPQQSPLW